MALFLMKFGFTALAIFTAAVAGVYFAKKIRAWAKAKRAQAKAFSQQEISRFEKKL